jgi:ATP-dependent helicase/nuclease subunit B
LKNASSEFASSGFVPVKIEDRTSITYPLTEKTKISLDGVADRVDVLEKDGKKYVRIVDYKTGKKDISPEDVKAGFEMQMLTYLFSNCKDGDIPAGVMYFLCGFPSSGTPPFMRNGIMLDCEEVKDEMKFLTDNSLFKKAGFQGKEVIDELKTAVEENVQTVGKNIIDGKMNISPMSRKKKSPCTYCSAKLYCRKKLSEDDS